MAETIVDALPKMGPYGALFFVLLIYVVDRLVGRSDMKVLMGNHLQHIQDGLDALVQASEDQTELMRETKEEQVALLREVIKDLALQHQTIDNIWRDRRG